MFFKFKTPPDKHLKIDTNERTTPDEVENIIGKGENAGYQHGENAGYQQFLLSHIIFKSCVSLCKELRRV